MIQARDRILSIPCAVYSERVWEDGTSSRSRFIDGKRADQTELEMDSH